jgi:DNA-binding response OmpR family regulator
MANAARGPTAAHLPRLVLLVEDNALIAMSTADQLREAGVEDVMVVASVAQAQASCARHRFDFAVLDFNLAQGTSVELARQLRAANIRFVFASGLGDRVELPADLAGCAILGKPYLIAELAAAMQER